MAKMMLTAQSNGRTGSVGGLLNLGGADLKEVVNSQAQVYSQSQNAQGFWKGVFQLGRVAVHPSIPPIVPLVNPVSSIVDFGSRLCKTPSCSEGQPYYCQAESLHPDLISRPKAPSDWIASIDFPQLSCTNQNMALVEKWKNTQTTIGCSRELSTWFEERPTSRSDLAKLTTELRPTTQEPLQENCTAVAKFPSAQAKFADEDQHPQEPVDSWEELHDNLAVRENVAKSECLSSPVLCESTQPCSEVDGEECDDGSQHLLHSASALEGGTCHGMKTPHSDSPRKSSPKLEHSDLSYVLFDRRGKHSGKSRKHRRQSKQKSKQQSSAPDSMMDCLAVAPFMEDPLSDVPPAPCEKGKTSKSARKKSKKCDDFGCDSFDQGLHFSGLGDFLPGCKKSVQAAPAACPRIPASQAEAEPVPSRIDCLNQAWGINLKKPGQIPPKEKSKVSFAEDQDLVTTHLQVAWGFAYRAARKGRWHLLALDASRFQNQAASIGQSISWVLAPEHRAAVYNQRFSCDD